MLVINKNCGSNQECPQGYRCVREVIMIYQKQSRNQNLYSNHTKEQYSSAMLELKFRLLFLDEATYMVCKRKVGTSDGYTFLMLLTLRCY